jgi:hypothetical protein
MRSAPSSTSRRWPNQPSGWIGLAPDFRTPPTTLLETASPRWGDDLSRSPRRDGALNE